MVKKFTVVALVAKKFVEVLFVVEELVAKKLVAVALVKTPFVANMLVLVELVITPLVAKIFCVYVLRKRNVEEPRLYVVLRDGVILPATCNLSVGVVVPITKLPLPENVAR